MFGFKSGLSEIQIDGVTAARLRGQLGVAQSLSAPSNPMSLESSHDHVIPGVESLYLGSSLQPNTLTKGEAILP